MGLCVVGWSMNQGGGDSAPIVKAVTGLGADVVVIGEFRKKGKGALDAALRSAGYEAQTERVDPNPRGNAGLLVASRIGLEPGELSGQSFFIHVRAGGWDLACCAVPGANSERRRDEFGKATYWRFLVDLVAPTLSDRKAMIIGDLSTGLPYRDEDGISFVCHEEMRELEAVGWRDVWAERNRTDRPPSTWWDPKSDSGFRMDHAYLSPGAPVRPRARVTYPYVLGDVVLAAAHPPRLSDHAPQVVILP